MDFPDANSIPLRPRERPGESLLAGAEPEFAVEWTQKVIAGRKWTFDLQLDGQLRNLATYMTLNAETPSTKAAAQSWPQMQHHSALSLHDHNAAKALWELLNGAGVQPSSLVIRIQKGALAESGDDPRGPERLKQLQITAVSTFGVELRTEYVEARRGNPKIYLLVGRAPLKPGVVAPSARLRMHEFNGLFFALLVFQFYREST